MLRSTRSYVKMNSAAALQEAKAGVEVGRYTSESVVDHVKRVADDV